MEPSEPLKVGKIRDSNRTTLISQLKATGLAPLDLGIAPDRYVSAADGAGWPSGRDRGGYIFPCPGSGFAKVVYWLACAVTHWPGEGKRRGHSKLRHARNRTHANIHAHTRRHSAHNTHTRTHARTRARTHARTHIFCVCVSLTHTHIYTYARTHAHAYN